MPVPLEQVLTPALAVVFLWSGAAKLGSPRRLVDALTGILRLPSAWASPAARIFSLAEAGVAVLVVFPGTSGAGAGLAFLLGASILLISVYAGMKRRVYSCGCFGSTSMKPIGWRNAGYGALMAVAAVAILMSPSDASVASAESSLIRACVITSAVLVAVLVVQAPALRRPLANFALRKA